MIGKPVSGKEHKMK